MCSLNLRCPPHFERLTCCTSLSDPGARAFSYFRVSTVTIGPTLVTGIRSRLAAGNLNNGSDNGDYKIMNFWDWPCDLFFTQCTFDIFAGVLLSVTLTAFVVAVVLLVWVEYKDMKNKLDPRRDTDRQS